MTREQHFIAKGRVERVTPTEVRRVATTTDEPGDKTSFPARIPFPSGIVAPLDDFPLCAASWRSALRQHTFMTEAQHLRSRCFDSAGEEQCRCARRIDHPDPTRNFWNEIVAARAQDA